MTQGTLILDRYEPLGTAGAGGFGTVQIAWDPRIQRRVAIKTIGLSEADVHRASLPGANAPIAAGEPVTSLSHLPGLDEARTAAKLSDSRIVTVFDFEVRDRTAYLIMEYVEGVTLSRFLAEQGDRLTLDMVAAVFDAVAGALEVAHAAGVLHLDIKPDNIIINPQGHSKVTDFGLATLADASGAGTTGGGTIGYMPLEQMRRQPLDARTDEWSLAALTYEMLTGENPFRAPSLADAEKAIEDAELVLPSLCWEDIDEQVDDVIFYALDPDPGERYATVADFAEEMDKFLGDPEAGTRQLAALIAGPNADAGDDSDPDDLDWPAGRRASFADRLQFGMAERFDERWLSRAGRAFGAVASAAAAWLAAQSLPLDAVVGSWGVPYACAIVALVAGAVGAIRPHAGALMAFSLLGIATVFEGLPIEGIVLIAGALAWWYAIARHGTAAGNTALLVPLASLVDPGLAAGVPLIAGTALRPLDATATAALSSLAWIALAQAPLDALSTWSTAAGWVLAALAYALLSMRGNRLLAVAGLAMGVSLVAIGSLAFSAPTPPLIISLVVVAAALLVLR